MEVKESEGVFYLYPNANDGKRRQISGRLPSDGVVGTDPNKDVQLRPIYNMISIIHNVYKKFD